MSERAMGAIVPGWARVSLGSVVAWKLCRAVAVCGAEGLGGESFRLRLPTVFWDPFKSTAVMG